MHLGCTIPLALFTASVLPPDLATLTPQDDRQALIKSLHQHGVRSIELHGIDSRTSATQLSRAATVCYTCGMALTLHGTLCEEDTPAAFFKPYMPLFAQGNQPFYTVTLHGLPDPAVTAQHLEALVSYAVKQNLAVHLVLENDHHTEESNAADCCDSVERIVKDLPFVDICWDMGHYYSNVLTQKEAGALPSEAFLRRVRHTHIHAVGTQGMHLPFSLGELPLIPYLTALTAVGYDGVANAELSPSRFYQTENPFTAYLNTVDELQEALSSLG